MFKFFVGTKQEDLLQAQSASENFPIAMLDGTVPNWKASNRDVHFDHHREGGEKIQIDEMSGSSASAEGRDFLVATTQLDADACVAAAYFISGDLFSEGAIRRLRAIAYDCDHLCVPDELADLAEFAAKAVATFEVPLIRDAEAIQLGLNPSAFKEWSEADKLRVSALRFERMTLWLIAAALGEIPWPGELGEADEYQAKLNADAEMLIAEARIQLISGVPVGDGTGKGRIDPRSFLMAWEKGLGLKEPQHTLTYRDHRSGSGVAYTIASSKVDLTAGFFALLSAAEKEINPQGESWGGRATVGGSGWNTPSRLSAEQIASALTQFSIG